MTTHNFNILLRATRGPFLILTLVSVLLGIAPSLASAVPVQGVNCALLLAGALLAHISVNSLNEYLDFRSGLDHLTHKTPFSGGSGALPEAPAMADRVLIVAVLSLVGTIAIGLLLSARVGTSILPLGLTGILIITTYTQWLNRHPFLCLVAPGLGFGPLMVMGTDLVISGGYSWRAFFISIIVLFLVSNLLLLNQLPDIEADKRVGRRHFPIVYGIEKSIGLYAAFVLSAAILIAVGSVSGLIPMLSLISLLPLTLGIVVYLGARRVANETLRLVPYLGLNVVVTLLTPTLLAMGIIYG